MLENCDNFEKKKKVKTKTQKILLEKAWKKRSKLFFLKTRWLILKNKGPRWEEWFLFIYFFERET